MKPVALILALALGLLIVPLAAQAQPAGKVYRVALVYTTAPVSEMAGPDPVHPFPRAFLRALGTLGYVQGQNLVYMPRSAEGKLERLGEILKELVSLKVDVIVAPGDEIPRRAKEVTTTVPFVMMSFSDPVELDLVASLARPGGNITGVTRSASPEIEGKRVELLKEALPKIRRVTYLGRKRDWESPFGQSAQTAARVLGVTLLHAEHTPTDYSHAFASIVRERPDALLVAQNTPNFAQRRRIVDFATKNRLPSMYHTQEFVDAGGLMSYGADLADLYRRAAVYVDKVLRGARPADLPVEQPTKFGLVINLKTAKALGLTIPPSVVVRADQVIE
ncbi:MAG: ABC transporter substrate-binding protein [Candidatus Rokubacteria bacterium]|nr:ABC transporter substrate-binding protein [Candidatus Rokubacteria bacterium]